VRQENLDRGAPWRAAAAACALVLALGAAPGARAEGFECLIKPSQEVSLRSPEMGLIARINVHRGDTVKAGEPLVELESSAQRSAVAAAKFQAGMTGKIAAASARVDYAKKNLARMSELQTKHFIAVEKRDDAQAQEQIARSELLEAKEDRELAQLAYRHQLDLLELRTLRSPFNGVVVDRVLNPGDLAENGTDTKPILKLAKIDPLHVEVILPVRFYGKLHRGMAGVVTPVGLEGHYNATVTAIDRMFDAASGTFGVRLTLRNPKEAVPGGIRCHVDFPQLQASGSGPEALH